MLDSTQDLRDIYRILSKHYSLIRNCSRFKDLFSKNSTTPSFQRTKNHDGLTDKSKLQSHPHMEQSTTQGFYLSKNLIFAGTFHAAVQCPLAVLLIIHILLKKISLVLPVMSFTSLFAMTVTYNELALHQQNLTSVSRNTNQLCWPTKDMWTSHPLLMSYFTVYPTLCLSHLSKSKIPVTPTETSKTHITRQQNWKPYLHPFSLNKNNSMHCPKWIKLLIIFVFSVYFVKDQLLFLYFCFFAHHISSATLKEISERKHLFLQKI